MAQRGSQSKPTRFKGPTVITLRGAGSTGNDPLKVGDGSDIGLDIQVPAAVTINGDAWGQTANSFQISKPAGTVVFQIDGFGNIYSGNLNATLQQCARVLVTPANITGMYAASVNLIPAPAANQLLIVDAITVQTQPGATQFTAGGAVSFIYHGTAVTPHTGTITAAQVNSATASYTYLGPLTSGALVLTTALGLGLDITNATQAFATGNGDLIVTIWYSTLTLG